MRLRGTAGQASVELVALVPVLMVLALGVAQLLAAGVARELAAHAAEGGAIALGNGEDPRAAVRDALPGWARDRVSVTVQGRRVAVAVRPVTVFPGAGAVLAAHALSDAGPAVPALQALAPAPARRTGDVHGDGR